MKKHDHHLFLSWLILTGVIFFSIIICWQLGLFQTLFTSDKSKISIAICLIYSLGTLHCALRAWQLSSQLLLARKTSDLILDHQPRTIHFVDNQQLQLANAQPLPQSMMTAFLIDSAKACAGTSGKQDENRNSTLAEIYADKLKSSHEYGWFFVDAMIKLGLLGTIVGFILMLGSVADSSALDLNAMQKVMQQMSAGMGTALYTTLTGLLGSLLLALQYQLLDRGADDLIQTAVHIAEVNVLPNLITDTESAQ